MTYSSVDAGMIKHKIGVIYQELSDLRNQIEMLEPLGDKDAQAYERLNILGEKIKNKIGAASTKDIIADVRV